MFFFREKEKMGAGGLMSGGSGGNGVCIERYLIVVIVMAKIFVRL